MKLIKKILKRICIVILSFVVLLAIADFAWIHVPELSARHRIKEIAELAQDVNEIPVSHDARIYAIGEASHGNVEFQQLKLEVLKQLVEKDHVRVFALEADFCEGLKLNEFIHGTGEFTDAKDAVMHMAFNIYHTDQMIALVQWMKDYNETAEENEQLSFYGFDLQNPGFGLEMLIAYCKENQLEYQALEDYLYGDFSIVDEEGKNTYDLLCTLEEQISEEGEPVLSHLIQNILNLAVCNENGGINNYIYFGTMRDQYMYENVMWILDHTKEDQKILISGHNGHVGYTEKFYDNMGKHLKDELGTQYFVIGTDFFKTTCNINRMGADATRKDYAFNSADVLAYQAKYYGGSYYLDLHEAYENEVISSVFQKGIYMGSLGEGYSTMMRVSPMSYRVNGNPLDYFDAMILVYQASPIVVDQE